MSDESQGQGWWLASDNKWYGSELTPSASPTVPRSHPDTTAVGPKPYTAGPSAPSRHPKSRLIAMLAAIGAAVVLAAVLVFTLGSSSGANAFAGKSGSQVLAVTMAAAKRQGSVHLAESDKPTGSGTYDVGSNSGRQTIADGSEGNATLLVLPGIAYLNGDAAFLENEVGLSVSNASLYAERWISFVPSDTSYDYQQLVSGDTLSSALSESTPSGRLTLTSERTVDGQRVVGVSGGLGPLSEGGAKGSEVLYVSTVAPYLPVELVVSATYEGNSGSSTLTFSDWDEPISVAAPSDVTPASAIPTSTS